ncbi:unnamed protein product [Trichobilharzia szidati]|nr:unnamed protein product [Trichobilharzia szidati]
MSTGKQHLTDISTTGENTFHCRRICPRMGVNQRQYREAKQINLPNDDNISVNTSQIKSSVNNSINKSRINNNNSNGSNNSSLLERYPILRRERQSSGVEKRRRSGQTLLTGMMKSTRRPIKARHSLQNKDMFEATQMTNTLNAATNNQINSTTHSHSWKMEESNTMKELRLSEGVSSIDSSPNILQCRQRVAIFTNPDVRRRISADSLSLNISSINPYVNFKDDTPTPAKRPNIDHTFEMFNSDLGNRNDSSTESHQPNLLNLLGYDDTSSSLSSPTVKKTNLTSTKYTRWSLGTTKRFSRRSSTGSLSTIATTTTTPTPTPTTVQSSDSECHQHDMTTGNSQSTMRFENYDIFKGLRRSARRTFSSLCNVLRHSNSSSSLTTSGSSNLKNNRLSDSNSLSTISVIGLLDSQNDKENEGGDDYVEKISSFSSNSRHVTVSRPNLSDSFGLFVIKSEQGYRVTRLSDRFSQEENSINNRISIGDEIVQVNGMSCTQLDTNQLQELFRKHQSLDLIIISQ